VGNFLYSGDADDYQAVKRLLDDVLGGRLEDLSLSALVRENTRLLACKIVERTGKTGEHYIANTRSEYWSMWRAAVGGGLLTVATAAIKIRITTAGFPPFVEGFLTGRSNPRFIHCRTATTCSLFYFIVDCAPNPRALECARRN
jgi:site-specific recombinase